MQYVSKQTPLEAEEVEILMIKQQIDANTGHHTLNPSIDQVQILGGQETVAGLRVKYTLSQGHLVSINNQLLLLFANILKPFISSIL